MKICFVSSSRADYGLLKNLMSCVAEDQNMDLQVALTGAHLDDRYGYTAHQIEMDGFNVDAKIPLVMNTDDAVGVAATIASATEGFGHALKRLDPDLVFVLGDRHEMLGAVLAAHVAGIPIAHHSGGDVTTGAYDDAMRHCITKCADYHFVSCEASYRRVVQMGENPQRVFLVGGLGTENIVNAHFLSAAELERDLSFSFCKKNLLITFHPETASSVSPPDQIRHLLNALEAFPDVGLIFTAPNHDVGSFEIYRLIEFFVGKRSNSVLKKNLGEIRYHSAAKLVDGVVGNSSSGICEIPSLGKAVLNIGNRQNGRERASCVIDCTIQSNAIASALTMLLSDEFQEVARKASNPYDHGVASENIMSQLRGLPVSGHSRDSFHNLEFELAKC